ncbi:SprB repeat-containing protein [Flavobacterium frigoris]|nr:SprB repeat-containing protein [Flavobacterium frigoris]
MRKIYLFILLGFCINGFGQSLTYTVKIHYEGSRSGCHGGGLHWSFSGDSNIIGSGSLTINNEVGDKTYPTVSKYSQFKLNLNITCVPLGAATVDCNDDFDYKLFAPDLLKSIKEMQISGCIGDVSVTEFKPNGLSISSASTEVCSGTDFTLTASPAGFPDVAYHWQYSTDKGITWINFPATMQKSEGSSVRTTNDTPNINFSMDEILGTNHSDFFNKQIYFRLGYDERPFTTATAITYSACAPVVTGISYEGPKCSGDTINKIEVTFDRELYIDKGEVLKSFSLRDRINPMISIFQFLTDVTFSGKMFSFQKTDLDKIILENGHKYFIQQQAYIGTAGKGILDSDSQYDLEYVAPAALKFIATKKQDVSCNGGSDGTIEIKVWGGTPKTEGLKYNYYVDGNLLTQNITETTTSGETTAILPGISVLKDVNGLIIPHQIKVTDAENCFEK